MSYENSTGGGGGDSTCSVKPSGIENPLGGGFFSRTIKPFQISVLARSPPQTSQNKQARKCFN